MSNYTDSIPTKMMMYDLLDEGAIDPKWLACALIGWMEESDAKRFCEVNEIRVHFHEDIDC